MKKIIIFVISAVILILLYFHFKMPPGFHDIPLYPDCEVTDKNCKPGVSSRITIQTSASVENVVSFYIKELGSRGGKCFGLKMTGQCAKSQGALRLIIHGTRE
jgi:hypothetical protein